jgi:hypothetical protein
MERFRLSRDVDTPASSNEKWVTRFVVAVGVVAAAAGANPGGVTISFSAL